MFQELARPIGRISWVGNNFFLSALRAPIGPIPAQNTVISALREVAAYYGHVSRARKADRKNQLGGKQFLPIGLASSDRTNTRTEHSDIGATRSCGLLRPCFKSSQGR